MSKPFDTSVRKYDKGGNIIEKLCKNCGNWLSITNFYKQKITIDGYQNDCKNCRKKYNKKWYEDKKK